MEAQFSPVYEILIDDFDKDDKPDILLGGNLYRAKPETGIYDASYGLMLKGNGDGTFVTLSPLRSGVSVKGEIRALKKININNNRYIVIGINNDRVQCINY